MGEEFSFKALEKQMKEALSVCDNEDEVREALRKALFMLPKYKRIEEHIETIKQALIEAHDFNMQVDFGHEYISDGHFKQHVLTGLKTITIDIVG